MSDFPGGVSFVLPVFNGAKYLSAAIKSVLNQTCGDFELIVIDDGSGDDSALIAENFGDSRIRVIRKQHTGLADTLNLGLNLANGKWIARIDADDIAVPARLELQSAFVKRHPEVNVIAGHSVYFSGEDKIEFRFSPPAEDDEIKRMLNVHNPINHSTVTFDKSAVMQSGGYNSQMQCFEDFEMWLRLKDKLTFGIIPENLAFTRLRDDSMSANASFEKIYEILKNNIQRLQGKGTDSATLEEIRFRVEYFYGDRAKARSSPGTLNSLAKLGALLSTFLPDESFRKVRNSRLRYRLAMSKSERSKLRKELSQLLGKQ